MASKEATLAKIVRTHGMAGKDAKHAIRDAAPAVQADKEVLLAAVAMNGTALKYAAVELQADKDVVLAAVAMDGTALKYAAAELQ
eukprot:SAG11_NODE_1684_length_4449_cov_7.642299_5_plen_84_part_01